MSRLNRRPRTFNTKPTFRTVFDPRVDIHHPMYFPSIRDYISVPRLSTQGEWPISYMLSDEQLVHLAVMANHLPERHSKRPREAGNAVRKRVERGA